MSMGRSEQGKRREGPEEKKEQLFTRAWVTRVTKAKLWVVSVKRTLHVL